MRGIRLGWWYLDLTLSPNTARYAMTPETTTEPTVTNINMIVAYTRAQVANAVETAASSMVTPCLTTAESTLVACLFARTGVRRWRIVARRTDALDDVHLTIL